MTNEEAIKVIKANYPSGGYEDLCQALEKAIKMLEDSRWIPVTERLPDKEHTKYVVTLDNGEVENRWWLGCFWVESVGKVIAWKPLSKPYEGSEEE